MKQIRSPRTAPIRTWIATLALAASAAAGAASVPAGALPPPSQEVSSQAQTPLYEVVKVVDGDTIHILRNGKKEKLRLLSVDTEEKLTPGMQSSATKPQTVYGEETRLWAIAFFEQLRDPAAENKIRVGLRFPEEQESYDIYGRLLCHVLLPDGTDFNLLLVQLGKSPYFNKYGNSLIDHRGFVEAQRRARKNLIGIWDPSTNLPRTPGTPSAMRPYGRLLPWWQVRAEAIDDFRARCAAQPRAVLHAEDADGLEEALTDRAGLVEVFGSPDRFFDEADGSLTVLFRATDRSRAFRARVPADSRAALETLDLAGLTEEFRQNFVYVSGTLTRGERGPEIVTTAASSWRRAGPEPGE